MSKRKVCQYLIEENHVGDFMQQMVRVFVRLPLSHKLDDAKAELVSEMMRLMTNIIYQLEDKKVEEQHYIKLSLFASEVRSIKKMMRVMEDNRNLSDTISIDDLRKKLSKFFHITIYDNRVSNPFEEENI